MPLTTAQIGKCGELLVQYQLLLLGIESAPMSTDSGVDLIAFHGYPRYTKDLDVWVELSPENAGNTIGALEAFGFGSLGIKPEDFLESDQIIQLGYPPNRIDILTSLKHLKFEECYKEKIDLADADNLE